MWSTTKILAVLGLCALSMDSIVNCENILMLLPISSKSHKRVFEPMVTAFAGRNHTVTIVSPYKPSKEQRNVREIVVESSGFGSFSNPLEIRAKGFAGILTMSMDFIYEDSHKTYQDPRIRGLLEEKFDLVLLDAFVNDCFYGLIHKLGAPFILVVPQAVPSAVSQLAGNFLPTSFVPSSMFSMTHEMSFFQRVGNFLFAFLVETILYPLLQLPKLEAVYKKELGEELPPLREISRNVSMIFSNSHFTQTFPRPLMPDTIEVGGMHCRDVNPLPKDLKEFTDGSKDGFILFSLGSIIKGHQMPEQTRKVFLNVFSRLKQRVLWKWETGEMEGLPPNVRLEKWLPQQDLFGHPNLKFFITHGGLLSTQEAVCHGVPLVSVPIFGDQNMNSFLAQEAGYGITVEILDVTEEILEKAIREMLDNQKYTNKARELSRVFKDQTETPVERAVFWSEYVMRHKGAHHLRSAARKLNYFQYFGLDVAATIGLVLVLILSLLIFGTKKVYRVTCGKKTSSTESKKKRQ